MTGARVGILHPGEMGGAIAAALVDAGREVLWCAQGRSRATAARAEQAGAVPCPDMDQLLAESAVVISVCPPHGAESLGAEVAARGYAGVFADVNAISPERAARVAASLEAAGAEVADGGVIGPPPVEAGTTRLYLSGRAAGRVAELFGGTRLEPIELGGSMGRASAFKMAYAALSKGTAALAAISRSMAEHHGVEEELLAEWERGPLVRRPGSDAAIQRSAAVAWRWVGEMLEISETALAAGLPGEMHEGAAEVFRRWAEHRDQMGLPVSDLLARQRRPPAIRRDLTGAD